MLISAGLAIVLLNTAKEQEIRNIRALTEKTFLMKANNEYEHLEEVSAEWESFERNHGYASHYNKGWANLTAFIKTGEVSAYLAAKNSFKESLRGDPASFDAKYNLSLTEFIAAQRGIEPFEIPDGLEPDDSQGPAPGANKKPSGSSDEQEQQGEKKDLKDKLSGGDAPMYTADPPEMDLVPGEEENKPPSAGSGY